MTDYDVNAVGKTLDTVRLYGDSLDPIRRGQRHQTVRHDVIDGATPSSDSNGLEPGEIRLAGRWVGADAATLADRLRTILNDPDITEVDVTTVTGSSEIDGRYRLTDEEVVERLTDSDAAWRYELTLIEQ